MNPQNVCLSSLAVPLRHITAIVALLFGITGAMAAQEVRAGFFGMVKDGSGAFIKGASVTVTEQATNLARTVATDEQGQFKIPILPAGTYSLTVEAPGFAGQKQTDVVLRVGDERRIDFLLYPKGVEIDFINVTAPITDSAVSTLSTVITGERIASLPLNGRQLQELALTAPGVTASGGFRSTAFNQFGLATPTDGNAGAFSVNGAGSRSNGFFLDGTDINVPEQGVIAFPPLVEAIREFQVQTSAFNAEFGRFAGSVVNLVTKSGTNEWHGSVYEFFRNDALDANDVVSKTNGLPRSVLRQNQFGATIGGPIKRDRIFIFGNYEGNRVRQGTGPFASNLPTAAQRGGLLNYLGFTDRNGNGVFDAGEPTAPATLNLGGRIAPISSKILDGFIPLPNVTGAGANYIANGLNKMNEDAFTVRFDAQVTQRDLLTARYLYDDQRQFYPFDIFFVAASLPAFPFPNPERRQTVALSHTHTFASKLVNEFRFGLNRQRNPIPNGTDLDPASLGLPNGAPQNLFGRGLPRIAITGFGGTGGQPFVDNLGASTTNRTLFQYNDTATVIWGAHTVKFGGELRRVQINSSAYRALRGALTFNGTRNQVINPNIPGNATVAALADYLLGLPALATIGAFNPTRGFRTTAFSGFIQDEWRATNRLTVNYGLRYEIDTPLTEVNGLLSNLIPGTGNFVVGSPELPRLHQIDRNNFGPRAGLAYRLTEDGKTVMRAGAGIFYDNGVLQDRFGTARSNAPFGLTAIDSNPTPFPKDNSPATTLTRLLSQGQSTGAASIDLHFRTPYGVQYNLNLQRELLPGLLAEVAYVGRRTLNASRPVNINQVVASNSPAATVLKQPVGSRPFNNPNLPPGARFSNNVNQQQSTGQATYHSLQVRLERRFAQGVSLLSSYTWSKSIDDVSGIGSGADDTPQDAYNLRAQRAVSNFDVTHKFVTSFTYELPFGKGKRFLSQSGKMVNGLVEGWQVNGVVTAQSGQPFTVTVGSFDSIAQIGNRRPNQISDPRQDVPAGFSYNPKAFVAPPPGQLGSVGRNTLRGDGYQNIDFAVFRNIRLAQLGESGSLQFRAEFFNLFNQVNFTLPVGTITSAAAGRFVSNATTPRQVQFALKLSF
ncbi:MAG: TonB-dependent receptor [Blastocatellia bacterium]|nr:TonB-dependent receptor [Blastocatellia bacterium]